jgi:biopolymer transport protein ExbB
MIDLIKEGGWVAWIILGCGVAAVGVFMERVLALHRARIRSEDFIAGIRNNLIRGNVAEALAICEDTPGPVAEIVKVAIMNQAADRDTLRAAVENTGRIEIARMERRLVVLATIAQVAPLFGLLGTVLGMIKGVQVMRAAAPLVQATDVMAGLMPALVATALGLSVAAPCYIAFNFLVGKVEKIVIDMEQSSAEILNFLARRGDAGKVASHGGAE